MGLTPKNKEEALALITNKTNGIIWGKSSWLNLNPDQDIGNTKYEVSMNIKNGIITLSPTMIVSETCNLVTTHAQIDGTSWTNYVCTPNWEAQPDIVLQPFELIQFVNKSDLSLVKGAISTSNLKPDSVTIIPAIFLQYAKDKKVNSDITATAILAANIAAVAIPFGEITWLGKFGNYVYKGIDYAGKVGAISNVLLETNIIDKNSNTGKFIENYNTLVAFVNLGQIGTGIGRAAIKQISKTNAEAFLASFLPGSKRYNNLSLAGCSSAEPVSVYPGSTNANPF